MPHSFGNRARTSNKLSKAYRKHGVPSPTRQLRQFRVNQYVTIKADPSVQAGMPYHIYHGAGGRIFNISGNSVSVFVKKTVNGRQVGKKLIVNTAHIVPSKSRQMFVDRCITNMNLQTEAKKQGVTISTKRVTEQPLEAEEVQVGDIVEVRQAMYSNAV